MSNKKRMKKEDRIQEILKAARMVFIEKGYKGATTIEIAKRADISEVTLFRYFSSKQDIFMQSVEPILTETLKEVISTTNGMSGVEQVKEILKDRIKLVSENSELIKLVLMEGDLENDLPAFNIVEKITELLKSIIDKLKVSEEKKNLFLRMFMGITLSFLFMPEEKEHKIDEFIEKMAKTFL